MGKGDQKTRRGKLFKGSYGVKRKRKSGGVYKPEVKNQEKAVEKKTETPVKKTEKTTVAAKKPSRSKKVKKTPASEESFE